MNTPRLKQFIVAGFAAGAIALAGQSAGAVSPTDPTDPSDPVASDVEELVPPATIEPVGLGDDPELDELAQQCYDGLIWSCDAVYFDSDIDSDYEAYGDTCGGRQPEGTGLLCVESFPGWAIALDVLGPPLESPVGLGDEPELDELADRCYEGEMYACDELYNESEAGAEYERYGDTCAGRQSEGTGLLCNEMARDAALEADPMGSDPEDTEPGAGS